MESSAIEQKVHESPPEASGAPRKIVYLVGTVHVSDNSARKVRETISTVLPDFVCLELDLQRFRAMQEMMKEQKVEVAGPENREQGAENSKPKTENRSGEGGQFRYSGGASHATGSERGAEKAKMSTVGGYKAARTSPIEMLTLPGMLRWMQQRIGEEFGVMPGQEMATAVETARGYGVRIALIDRPVQQTIGRMWNSMGFKEKMKLFSYVVAAAGFLFLKPLFGKKSGDFSMFGSEKERVEKKGGVKDRVKGKVKDKVKNIAATSDRGGPHISMEKLEKGEGVVELMQVLEREFPAVHTALVEERNVYMCNNIIGLLQKVNTLVVVVGMGHVDGMRRLLEKKGMDIKVV